MKITVIGCGRWGSFIAYYLDRIGNEVTIGAAPEDEAARIFDKERFNGTITMPDRIPFVFDLKESVKDAEIVVFSVPSQRLREILMGLGEETMAGKGIILCMKGLELETGKRLTQVVADVLPDNRCAVWVGPGHPQEFADGKPNCMVIDSADAEYKKMLVDSFTGDLIRFYYGEDLIGNEIGAATKNVIGIAAGLLDGLGLPSLKGALMARGTREIARLIEAMGGNGMSAYGLCHLGDYEATVFSKFSHNRRYGEDFVKGVKFDKLAEGAYTVVALMVLQNQLGVELPICTAVHKIINLGEDAKTTLDGLFSRDITTEFHK